MYSSTLDSTLDTRDFMSVEKGVIAPDLVVYIDTPHLGLWDNTPCHHYLTMEGFNERFMIYMPSHRSGLAFKSYGILPMTINGSHVTFFDTE